MPLEFELDAASFRLSDLVSGRCRWPLPLTARASATSLSGSLRARPGRAPLRGLPRWPGPGAASDATGALSDSRVSLMSSRISVSAEHRSGTREHDGAVDVKVAASTASVTAAGASTRAFFLRGTGDRTQGDMGASPRSWSQDDDDDDRLDRYSRTRDSPKLNTLSLWSARGRGRCWGCADDEAADAEAGDCVEEVDGTLTGVWIDDVPDELELEKVLDVEKLRLSSEDFLLRRL